MTASDEHLELDPSLSDYERDQFRSYLMHQMNYWQGYASRKEAIYITVTTLYMASTSAVSAYMLDNKQAIQSEILFSLGFFFMFLTYIFLRFRILQYRYRDIAVYIADGLQATLTLTFGQDLNRSDVSPENLGALVGKSRRERLYGFERIWKFPALVRTGFAQIDDARTQRHDGSRSIRLTLLVPISAIFVFCAAWYVSAAAIFPEVLGPHFP